MKVESINNVEQTKQPDTNTDKAESARSRMLDEALRAPITPQQIEKEKPESKLSEPNKDELYFTPLFEGGKTLLKPGESSKKEPEVSAPDKKTEPTSDSSKKVEPPATLEKERSNIPNDKLPPIEKAKPEKPLESDKDIEAEAKLLNDLTHKFLSGQNEKEVFKELFEEINKIAKSNDVETLKKVFDKIAESNKGMNPMLDNVSVKRTSHGDLMLSISPSYSRSFFGMNYRSVIAIVGNNSAFLNANLNDWSSTELRQSKFW